MRPHCLRCFVNHIFADHHITDHCHTIDRPSLHVLTGTHHTCDRYWSDSDALLDAPLSTRISPSDTAIGPVKDQFVMVFAPGHPILRTYLNMVPRRILDTKEKDRWRADKISGPHAMVDAETATVRLWPAAHDGNSSCKDNVPGAPLSTCLYSADGMWSLRSFVLPRLGDIVTMK